jgi:hypothetical protein
VCVAPAARALLCETSADDACNSRSAHEDACVPEGAKRQLVKGGSAGESREARAEGVAAGEGSRTRRGGRPSCDAGEPSASGAQSVGGVAAADADCVPDCLGKRDAEGEARNLKAGGAVNAGGAGKAGKGKGKASSAGGKARS